MSCLRDNARRSRSHASHRALTLLAAALLSSSACATDDPILDETNQDDGANNLRPANSGPGTPNTTQGNNATADADMSSQPDEDMEQTSPGSPDMNSGLVDMNTPTNNNTRPDDMSDPAGEDMSSPTPDMQIELPPTCADIAITGTTWDLAPAGLDGQLYSRSTFDGEAIWVTWAERESADIGAADIWVTRIGCDGQTLVPATKISDSPSGVQDVHPNIASRDGDVYVVWTQDTSDTDTSYMRAFKRDGTFYTTVPVDVTPQFAGQAISGLVWETDVAALPNSEAALVASFYSTKAESFQIVVQRFDVAGNLSGLPIEAFENKGVDQTRPSVTALEDGTLYISWTRYKAADPMAGTPEQPHSVVYTKIAPGDSEPDQTGPFPAQIGAMGDNQLSRYSKERTIDDKVYLAFQLDSTGVNDVLVKDGTFGAPLRYGTAGNAGLDFRPSVAARPEGGGGVLAWYRGAPSPTRNEIILQRFDTSTGGFMLGPEVTVPTTDFARAPYGPSISHVAGSAYVITWSEGATTGGARLKARIVTP